MIWLFLYQQIDGQIWTRTDHFTTSARHFITCVCVQGYYDAYIDSYVLHFLKILLQQEFIF